MNINFDTRAASSAAEQPARKPAPAESKSQPAQTRVTHPEPRLAEAPAPAPILQANVTFRRDSNGQVFYVVSDAQSGKEIREFPPEQVRKAGAGIEEFLEKQAQQAVTSHLELKA